jgi:hypothetical protein
MDSLGFLATLVFKWFGNREGNVNQQGLILFDRYIFPVSLLLDRALSRFFGKMFSSARIGPVNNRSCSAQPTE